MIYQIVTISMAYSSLDPERRNHCTTFSLWHLWTIDIYRLNSMTYFVWRSSTRMVSVSKIVDSPKRCNFRTSHAFCDEERQKNENYEGFVGCTGTKYRLNSLYYFYVESYSMSLCEQCIEIVRNQRLSRRVDQMAGLRFRSKILDDISPITAPLGN
jgi:hypothetical protein